MTWYIRLACSQFHKWTKHHGFGVPALDEWQEFLQEQWIQHVPYSWTSVKQDDVKFLRSMLGQFVVHGRDHALNEIHIFCPLFYWQVVCSTFGDLQVYRPVCLSPSETQQHLIALSRQSWLRPYRWGINRSADVPSAYILLKQKKSFLAARPIISYRGFIFAKLFRATAIVLDLLQRDCFPGTFGLATLPEMMFALQRFLSALPDDADLLVVNQDLVGFFTSIPVERILQAVRWMVNSFWERHWCDWDSYCFFTNREGYQATYLER